MAHQSGSQGGVIWIDQLVVNGLIFKARYDTMRKQLNNLFVTSKNEFSNSRI